MNTGPVEPGGDTLSRRTFRGRRVRRPDHRSGRLRDTLDKFLAFDKHAAVLEDAEVVEAVAVVEEQKTVTRAHRPRRRKSA